MEQVSWVGFLDIIGLTNEERKFSKLEEVKQFPEGQPSDSLLFELFEFSNDIYGNLDSDLHLLWFDMSTIVTGDSQLITPENARIIHKTISKNEIKFLKKLWFNLLGHYLLFLPIKFDMNITETNDEEEFIGELLREHKRLLLKTPDANEILHLSLSKS